MLNKFVASFADNGLDLKIYLNEEIPRLRSVIENGLEENSLSVNENTQSRAKKVIGLMDSYHQKEISTTVVEQVLKIQNLAREITQ